MLNLIINGKIRRRWCAVHERSHKQAKCPKCAAAAKAAKLFTDRGYEVITMRTLKRNAV